MTQLTIIALYLSVLLGLGVLAGRMFRGTSRDFTLASHSIGPFFLLMSLFGTTMTAFALVGSTGRAYTVGVGVYGMLASASGIVHSLCFFVIGIKLWRLGRRHGYTTQIQFFRDRLDSEGIGLLLFPVLVGLVIPYLLIGVLSAGTVINQVSTGAFEAYGWFASAGHGVPPWLASLVVSLVVLVYVFLGGMRGTAWANAFQTTVFMVLGVMTFVAVANRLGGTDSLLENMRAATRAVSADHLSRAGMAKGIYFSFLLIPLSVAMFPHVFQHWLTARSAGSFKLPIVAQPIFIMILWLPCVLLGVWASAPGGPLEAGIAENRVLAGLVQQLDRPALSGLLTAGILAAIMSSLDSQFLCIGTIFTSDVVLHYCGKERFSEKQIVLMARLFIVAIVAVTYLLSLLEPPVFTMGLWCFSGFAGLFPLVFAAVYWRRLTAAGAYASVLATLASWGYLFYQSDFASNSRFAVTVKIPGHPFPTLPVVTIFLCSLAAMIVVSLLTKPPSEKTLARFFPP